MPGFENIQFSWKDSKKINQTIVIGCVKWSFIELQYTSFKCFLCLKGVNNAKLSTPGSQGK